MPTGSATGRMTIPSPMPPRSAAAEAGQPKDPIAERYQGWPPSAPTNSPPKIAPE